MTNKEEMNMKCAARKADGKLCSRDHKSGCTYRGNDGWVYYLCQQHYDLLTKKNKALDLFKVANRAHPPEQQMMDLNTTGRIAKAWVNKAVENNKTVQTNTVHIQCRKCGIEADVTTDSESYKRFKQTNGLCKRCSNNPKPSADPTKRMVKVTCGKGENRHKWETTLAEFKKHHGKCPEHRA